MSPSAPERGVAVRGKSEARTVQRSLLGGILGGIGGAWTGAFFGALAGGPIGAILGGISGAIVGAAIGDDVTSPSRPLTTPEREYAETIFNDTLDYSAIRITRDSMYSVGSPLTIGNTVHMKSTFGQRWVAGALQDIPLFVGDTMELTNEGLETLIHELAHVWQYQNGGLAYIPLSLAAQFGAFVSGGDRGGAYDWRQAHAANTPWAEWNPEQQAAAVEDYNKLLRKSNARTASSAEIAELAILTTYMDFVWRRLGAPHFESTSMGDAPL